MTNFNISGPGKADHSNRKKKKKSDSSHVFDSIFDTFIESTDPTESPQTIGDQLFKKTKSNKTPQSFKDEVDDIYTKINAIFKTYDI
jgi:ribosomal protein S11